MKQLEFEEFYQTSRDACLRAVLAGVGDRQLAEDLVTEAVTRAWMTWPKVSRHPAPSGWIVRTAFNTRISWWHWRRLEISVPGVADVASIPADASVLDAPLIAAVRQLPRIASPPRW
ncbi:sigma factor [Streptomyces aureus]|uniref:sigma factor n=1 Tax=Streptomyces aureus TaxID=193461 RepID=UPI0036BED8DD